MKVFSVKGKKIRKKYNEIKGMIVSESSTFKERDKGRENNTTLKI